MNMTNNEKAIEDLEYEIKALEDIIKMSGFLSYIPVKQYKERLENNKIILKGLKESINNDR